MTPPQTPRKRKTTAWKAVAAECKADATFWHADALREKHNTDEAKADALMWKDTATFNERLARIFGGVAFAEAGVLLYLWLR